MYYVPSQFRYSSVNFLKLKQGRIVQRSGKLGKYIYFFRVKKIFSHKKLIITKKERKKKKKKRIFTPKNLEKIFIPENCQEKNSRKCPQVVRNVLHIKNVALAKKSVGYRQTCRLIYLLTHEQSDLQWSSAPKNELKKEMKAFTTDSKNRKRAQL